MSFQIVFLGEFSVTVIALNISDFEVCSIHVVIQIAYFYEFRVASWNFATKNSFLRMRPIVLKKAIFTINFETTNFVRFGWKLTFENHPLCKFGGIIFYKIHYKVSRFWHWTYIFELFWIKVFTFDNAKFKIWLDFVFLDEFLA